MYSKKSIIVIDFDETLYKKDSLIEFCKFVYTKKPLQIWAIIPQSIGSLLYLLRIINTKKYKEIFLMFLYGINETNTLELANMFWSKIDDNQFNEEIISIIKTKDARVICISASPELYLKPIMNKFKIEYIGTIIRFLGTRYYIEGENCKGVEKVIRLKKYLKSNSLEIDESYSDSLTDKPLFNISKKAFVVNKNGSLSKYK